MGKVWHAGRCRRAWQGNGGWEKGASAPRQARVGKQEGKKTPAPKCTRHAVAGGVCRRGCSATAASTRLSYLPPLTGSAIHKGKWQCQPKQVLSVRRDGEGEVEKGKKVVTEKEGGSSAWGTGQVTHTTLPGHRKEKGVTTGHQ